MLFVSVNCGADIKIINQVVELVRKKYTRCLYKERNRVVISILKFLSQDNQIKKMTRIRALKDVVTMK